MKILNLLALIVLSAVLITGCAFKAEKQWSPTGGSRADATVELSYEYDPRTEVPIVDEQKGLEIASQRCRVWGYTGAEAFGGIKTQCTRQLGDLLFGVQCVKNLVTKQYQCLGQGN